MVSNNVLAGLLAVAIVLSIGSLSINLGLFGAPIPITGYITGVANVTVAATTTISLPVSTVSFGSLNNGDVRNTTTSSPPPFVLQNDGTVNVNVTISADNLWSGTGAANPSTYYRFNSTVNETGSVTNATTDLAAITNMPSATTKVVDRLKFTNANDAVNVNIYITVPDDESAGAKGSTVTMTASQA